MLTKDIKHSIYQDLTISNTFGFTNSIIEVRTSSHPGSKFRGFRKTEASLLLIIIINHSN
jgi:hypothetical protein